MVPLGPVNEVAEVLAAHRLSSCSGHSFWPPHAARATSPHRVVLRNTRVAQLADACE